MTIIRFIEFSQRETPEITGREHWTKHPILRTTSKVIPRRLDELLDGGAILFIYLIPTISQTPRGRS